MTEFLVRGYCSPEKHNNLLEQGYRYMVEGEYYTGDDDSHGRPILAFKTWYFTDKDEAIEYGMHPRGSFHSTLPVKEVEHEITYAEEMAFREAELNARLEREAAELGMTLEVYKEYREEKRERYKKEIEELKAELALRQAWLDAY